MAKKKAASKFLETRYFGLVIGVVVFLLLFALSSGTVLVRSLEQKLLDLNFRFKNTISATRVQEGVSVVQQNPRISPDILIVGIDDKALDRFGRWPFPRFRHADLINSFSRIKNQADRERALFIDVFFSEPSEVPEDDALLLSAIKANQRVFLETVLLPGENSPQEEEEFFARENVLASTKGTITNVKGDFLKVNTFYGLEAPPLKPYAAATYAYGHANFLGDQDQIYRRQPLVAKLSQQVDEMPLDELTPATPVDHAGFEHLTWVDKNNEIHEIPYPLTPAVISSLKRQMAASAPLKVVEATDNAPAKSYYVIRKYKDTFIPSITLSLALEYMHKKMSDVEVDLGKFITIPSPQKFNVGTQQWEPYTLVVTPAVVDKDGNITKPAVTRVVPEVRIPIDPTGSMLINFMGDPSSSNPEEHQTYPVRSYAGYAANPPSPDPARWPATKELGNVIVMVGPFAKGMAADEKPTPFGLMYGVEMHANALNTILMGNFLTYASPAVNTLLLFLVVMLVSLMVSRLSTIWSLVVTVGAIIVYFFAFMLIFEYFNLILTFSAPAFGAFLAFLAVVAYRTVFEERDKRRITSMFGKFVSQSVVDEMISAGVDPALGGVDKELTVFFSDIRGFTTLSESLSPQELVNHLNQYLTAMTDLILDYAGTLDKYVGDEIMCFWGAPVPEPDHALLACKCAIRQMEVLGQMNKGWPPEKRLDIGIGLNTGIMTVGNMGSVGRMNYTLMGDNVNLGARLEGTNKQYMSHIIISESTYAQVKDKVVARELDNIRVKGKNKPVLIYELVDVVDGLEPPAKKAV
ncbi:MAG TPA: adenylate/guanylate cyclase domain-containing protein [Spirochaetia bacterium]|nr:adenylate/guanylate cyclase domain-containing protein [Spirochaetia bacterium]